MTLRERRKALGLTQAQLAKRMGIATATWHKWENAHRHRHAALLFEPEHPARFEALLRKVELNPHSGTLRRDD